MTRREILRSFAGTPLVTVMAAPSPQASTGHASRRTITLEAQPTAVAFEPATTAVLVVDMQNDFGAVGQTIKAPDGSDSRILVRDTWNTEILPELAPESGDEVLYKTRFSGFYKTDLDTRLASRGIRHLMVTGCTTSICVESTVRDAMFRDYLCVLLADCMSEPIGGQHARTNHEASLLSAEVLLGWTSTSEAFVKAVSA